MSISFSSFVSSIQRCHPAPTTIRRNLVRWSPALAVLAILPIVVAGIAQAQPLTTDSYDLDYATHFAEIADEEGNGYPDIYARVLAVNSEPTGLPAITAPNVFRVPAVLTADLSGITDSDGMEGIPDPNPSDNIDTVTYKWQRFDSTGNTMEADYIGTLSTYTLTDADAGKRIKVVVQYIDDAGYTNGPLTSAATDIITADDECAAPTYVGGATQIWKGPVGVGTWTASPDTYYGFRKDPAVGSLDNTAFTTAGSDDHEITALVTSNNTVDFRLEAALQAADRKTMVLHVCDQAEFKLDSATVARTASYTFANSGQDWTAHAGRVLYLSQDQAAPAVASATVDGTSLVITFNEPLAAAGSLDNDAFTVRKSSPAQTLTLTGSPAISGNTVMLTLDTASSVTASDSNVKVAYTKPDSGSENTIVDRFGNETATFGDQDVGNLKADTTAPALAANSPAVLAADGLTLTLTYNEALNETSVPLRTAFTVKATPAGGSEDTLSLARSDGVSVSGSAVTLKLASPIAHNDASVKVSYIRPTSGPAIKDAAGNDARGFTDQVVTNHSTIPRVSIEAVYATATSLIAPPVFRVTRSNISNTDLIVELEIAQDIEYVTVPSEEPLTIIIPPNQTTATDTLLASYVRAISGNLMVKLAGDDAYAPAVGSSGSATVFMQMQTEGDLLTISLPHYYYTVEEGESVDLLVTFTTGPGVVRPRGDWRDGIDLFAFPGTATRADYPYPHPYFVVAEMTDFTASGNAYTTDKPATVQTSEDTVYEGNEQFYVELDELSLTNSRTVCPNEYRPTTRCRITVTILDDDTLQVSDVAVTSIPTGGYYGVGDDIEFTVTFNGAVTVDDTNGTPEFTLNLGDANREAGYSSGSNSDSLVFSYTVAAGDNDHDGIAWDANSLDPNGGTIKFMHTEADQRVSASLEHIEQSALPDHKVDTAKPTLVSAKVEEANLYLIYSEDLNTTGPANGAFAVKVDGGAGAHPTAVSVADNVVTLTLASTITRDHTVTVNYAKPTSNPIKDRSGKEADAFGDENVDYVSDIRNLRATPGDRRAELEWEDPDDSAIHKYEYRKRNESDTDWTPDWGDIPGSNDDTTSHMLNGLTNGMEYTFQVRPVYRRNNVDTPGKEGQVKTIPRGALVGPVNLTATSAGDGEIALNWDDPNDATLTGYQYRYRNSSDTGWNPDWTHMSGSGATTTSRTLSGLTNNLLYTVEVRALRGNAQGPAARATAKPRGPLTSPANFTATPGDRRVALSWDGSGDDSITGYQYRYRATSEGGWNPDWSAIPGSRWNTTSYTVRSLVNRTQYTFEVRAMRGSSQGPASRTSAIPEGPPTVPLAPTGLSIREGDQSLSLSWRRPPSEDSRAPVTSYRVRYRQQGLSSWGYLTRSNDDLSNRDSITGLANRTHYDVQLAAVNRVGTGAWVSGTGTPQPPPAPEPDPQGVETFDVGTLGVFWLDGPGGDGHPDAVSGNDLEMESCEGTLHFRVIWSGPTGNLRADEWAAHINTRYGAGTVSHSFKESEAPGYFEMNGTVSVSGDSAVTVQVRGRWGANWGAWSPRSDLYCTETGD